MSPSTLRLNTNFGYIYIAAGTAPEQSNHEYIETNNFDVALRSAETDGAAIIRDWSQEDFTKASFYIRAGRKSPFPMGDRNFNIVKPNEMTMASTHIDRANTNEYLPLHADCTHLLRRPRFVFLYLESQAKDGGESIVTTFKEATPVIERLNIPRQGIDIWSQKNNFAVNYRWFQEKAARRDLTYSPYAHFFKLESETDFMMFSTIARAFEETIPRYVIKLKTGDALLTRNNMCLHGRKPFSGDRIAHRIWFD